jgi:hypothetical protein
LVETTKAESDIIAKAKQNNAVSDKLILDAKTELNKLKGQKTKLVEQRKAAQTKPEK